MVQGQEAVATVQNPSLVSEWLPILAGVALVVALVGAFVLAYRALGSAGVNVSPEAIKAIADGLAGSIEKVLSQAQAKADETTTPLDDALLDVAKYPVEAVIDYLRELGYAINPLPLAPQRVDTAVSPSHGEGESTVDVNPTQAES